MTLEVGCVKLAATHRSICAKTVTMRLARFHLVDVMIAVVFVGLFMGLAARLWGGFFYVPILVGAAVQLFLVYLLLIIMMSQYRDKSGSRRPDE